VNYSTESEIPGYSESACYRIRVWGALDESWSERFWGLSVGVARCGENTNVSTLEGRLADQAALAGILNTLYEMHFVILSIELICGEESEQSHHTHHQGGTS
jgi:hypothetical protein